MARPRSNDPIAPMDLANMRLNGVRSLAVQCHQCRHEVVMNVDHLPGELTVPSFGPRMVCTKCGMIGADETELAGTRDIARRGPTEMAVNFARLPELLEKADHG